jgi:hypothetical protein
MTLQLAVRIGVVACVAGACLLGAARLDNAVAVFDFQADTNAAASFTERNYPEIVELPGARQVFEDARLWMPEDATFRVVDGPRAQEFVKGPVRTFLDVLLMPRKRVELESAAWAFCYGCTPDTLGPGYAILSDSGDGFLFARRTA